MTIVSALPRGASAPPSPSRPVAGATDTLGCQASRLARSQELALDGMRLYRKSAGPEHLDVVETAPSSRGMLLGVSLAGGHRRRILQSHRATAVDFERGSIYLRDFGERYRADMKTPFDFLLLELPQAHWARAAEEAGGPPGASPGWVAGVRDEVLEHLALALLPALARPTPATRLYAEQVAVAMTTHIVQRHVGGMHATSRTRRMLSRGQERRAKDMLRGSLDGSITIAAIAEACELSRSYFIAAFRQTTGLTPYQWLLAQRVAHAQTLLGNSDLPLADIAAACGFADQSHLTRVFTQHVGLPPGRWRREAVLGR